MISTDWKKKSEKKLVTNDYLHVTEDELVLPNGVRKLYYVLKRQPFSIVIPYENGKIFMIRQFRYPVQALSLEFPMGVAKNKNPYETAEIELKEETGFTAGKLEEIGSFWTGPGKTDEVAHVFLAQELEAGEASPEEGEFLEMESYSVHALSDMIKNKEIKDGITISAYFLLEQYLRK